MSTHRSNRPAYLQGHPHLVAQPPEPSTVSITRARNEALCTECRRRVTVSDGTEYGHARGLRVDAIVCPHHCHNGGVR
ncbi:hypothetical protein G9463_18765 [Haloarcula sp. JP-Z28]|uniref:hypothetical protein n=1 Tax=Haloarcula sp. JP-Z28 TaxID=2716715 RepID=UPI00140492A9|nr:hypothetical protein [Haloarcula sp. JP-Z28]NHN65327.1 hypothetical protein [Haloarcula sp. JP-Z28]